MRGCDRVDMSKLFDPDEGVATARFGRDCGKEERSSGSATRRCQRMQGSRGGKERAVQLPFYATLSEAASVLDNVVGAVLVGRVRAAGGKRAFSDHFGGFRASMRLTFDYIGGSSREFRQRTNGLFAQVDF